MNTLSVVSQLAMDLFYQNYKAEDQFFELEHFQMMCANAYAKVLQDEFEQSKLLNKQLYGFSFVELSPDWLKRTEVTLKQDGKDYVAKIEEPVFAFSFDLMSTGIQRVVPATSGMEYALVKITANDLWQLNVMPVIKDRAFYYVSGLSELRFLKMNGNPGKVIVYYVPQVDADNDDALIPVNKAALVINTALEIMLAAKQGQVVKMTNNSNPNAIPQTELDKDNLK